MKLPAFLKSDEKSAPSKIAFRGGSYSLAVTAIVLAILIVVNLMASMLPSAKTKLDISSSKLYSITSATKVAVSALSDDVTIYWVVQAGEEDDVIENLLSKYESLSEHITVVKKNPDVYPNFAAQYTDETVENNSLIVECGKKSRFIGYGDIYLSTANYTTYSYDRSFDGEGAITSAIDYVTSDTLPQLYLLTGHGEGELPETFSDQIEKENIEVNEFSLLTEKTVPEEADCVLIYAPESDISEEEKKLLADYVSNGGKLMVAAGLTENGTLTMLYSLLEDYGVTVAEGVVVEADAEYYAFQQPYILLPDIISSDITDPLIDEGYYAIMPIAQGLTIQVSSGVQELLATSADSFSKTAGYAITTYDKEDGDTDGPFSLAVSVTAKHDGQIIWFSSAAFLEEQYNSYSSGANLDLGINALTALIGETESVSIHSKSLGYSYLTISDSQSATLKTLMIGVFPCAFLAFGILVIVKRRQRRNEQN